MKKIEKVLALTLLTPLLIVLFTYGAMLQPFRFGPQDPSRMCYDETPIMVRIRMMDSIHSVPFANVRLYSPNGEPVASAKTGPGGECSPISGVRPGKYFIVVEGARQMFVDFTEIYDRGDGYWKKQYLVWDDSYRVQVNYGLLPGKVEVGGLTFEVPPLTAVRIAPHLEYRFEDGPLSLRPLLEPFSDFLWYPDYATRILQQHMIFALLAAATAPLALPWRRRYAALAAILFLLVGTDAALGSVPGVVMVLQINTMGCSSCIINVVDSFDNRPPPYLSVVILNHAHVERVEVKLLDIQEEGGVYRGALRIEITNAIYSQIISIYSIKGATGNLAFSYTTSVPNDANTFPITLEKADYYRLRITVCPDLVTVDFRISLPPALTNRTAVSLITRFSFNTGFGDENPINYRGPALPQGVEQRITLFEMLPETVSVRQYRMRLLPDWAVRGEIARGLEGIVYAQPSNIFGLPVPGQEWVTPPSAQALDPKTVQLMGKVHSGYNPFFNQRIPFPFAPYYEFPAIMEIPLDAGRPGGGTVEGLENATYILEIKLGVDDHVFLSPPWFEEGDIVSYVYPISVALSALPYIPKMRQVFTRLKHLPDEIRRIFQQHGETPPPGVSDEIASAVQEALQDLMKEEVLSTRLHVENSPRIPPKPVIERLPPEQRATYEALANTLTSLRNQEVIIFRIIQKDPVLKNERFISLLADRLQLKANELLRSYPPGSREYKAGTDLMQLVSRLRTKMDLDEIDDMAADLLERMASTTNPVERQDLVFSLAMMVKSLRDAGREVRLIINANRIKRAFESYLNDLQNEIQILIRRILNYDVATSSKLSKLNLQPRAWTEDVVYTSFDLSTIILSLMNPAVGTAVAVTWTVFYVTSLGISFVHANIGNRDWLDPTGIIMAGAVAFKVRTPSGIRLAYISVAPDVGFGLFGGGYSASDIVDLFMRTVSRDIGYEQPVRVARLVANSPDEVAARLSGINWGELDDLIASAVGAPKSQIKLMGLAFMPVYIPYVNSAAFRIGKAYVFDFSDAINAITNRGITVDFVAIIPRKEVTDPKEMLDIIHPVSINDVTVDRSDWQIITTRVRNSMVQRPYLLYSMSPVIGHGDSPPTLIVRSLGQVPFTSVVRVNVTQEFIWDPVNSSGGFGVPCVADKKYFDGYFQVLDIRFYRYPVLGSSPPDKVVFVLRAENATIRPIRLSQYMKFESFQFTVRGDAFIWRKVGEDSELGITYWDGGLKEDVKETGLPLYRFIMSCGYGFDVNFGERDATRGVISGSVSIDGSEMAGQATLPTKAIFTVNAFRPPSQPNEPRITAEMTVGYHMFDPKGGPRWVEVWTDRREITTFPFRYQHSIGDLVMNALVLANRTGKPVTIRATMRFSNAPPGYLVVQPNPAEWVAQPTPLIGRTWTLTVRVLDASDRAPIANALVTVENKTHTFNMTTDTSGTASFTLTTGSYTVRATAEGYRPSDPRTVNLVNNTEVVLLLSKAPERTATVTVYVYNAETTAPIAGARVVLDSRQATTGGDGRAVFTNVPFGSYLLEVTRAGYSPYRRYVSIENDTVRIDVPLLQERPRVIATVTVLNAISGAPVAGATVQFENGTMVYTGVTGSDGIARIELPIGGYTLRVSASGYYPFSQTVFVPSSGFTATVRLTPVSESGEPPIPPTPPEECDSPLTTVRVTDSTTGAGIPGARVRLERGFVYDGVTDSSGEAKFCITSGIYSFRVEKEGYQTVEGTAFIAEGTVFNVVMTRLSGVPSGRLTVIVRDAASSSPIEGAEVSVQNSTHVLTRYTDADGRTEFVLIAGGYLIRARKSGYLEFSSELEFTGSDTTYIISLTPHGMCEYPGNWTEPAPCGYRWLVIDVRYRDGYPFANAIVTVSNSTMSDSRLTDGTGIAKFLLAPGNYIVSISATRGAETFTRSFTVNLDQNLWIMVFTPWYSPYFSPEVYPAYVSFLGPGRGIWNEEHLIGVALFSNVPQTVTVRVAAINYTKLAIDGTLQILAERTFPVRFTDSAFNTTVIPLMIPGSGFALVAPMVTVLSYESDTSTENNQLIGAPIPFGPLVDISLRIIVEVESAPTGALVPELTRMNVTVEFWSTHDLTVPGRLVLKSRFVSAETGRVFQRTLIDEPVFPRTEVQRRSVSYVLEWTNVTFIDVGLIHDLEVNVIDNNQTSYITLDRAVKLVSVKVPPTVRSGAYFNVTITVLSNWWPSWEYFYLAKIEDVTSSGSFRAYYGYSNVTVAVRAPEVGGATPKTMRLNMTVYPDFAPHDNSKEVAVTVVPEALAAAVPWILGLLGLLVLVVGGVAVARASRRAHALRRARRVLRAHEDRSWSWPHEFVEEKRRRRVLR